MKKNRMSKFIKLSDDFYDRLFRISKSLNVMSIDNDMKLTNSYGGTVLENPNDILDIISMVCNITGKVHNVEYKEEIPIKKERKKREPKVEEVEDNIQKKPEPKLKKSKKEKVNIEINLDNFISPKKSKK